MNDLFKKYILGKIIIDIHIIESQKRDFSYIYILLIMNQDDKIKDIEDIDNIIYTEIFDYNINSNLYNIVIINIIYNLYNLKYMINEKCLKKYS